MMEQAILIAVARADLFLCTAARHLPGCIAAFLILLCFVDWGEKL